MLVYLHMSEFALIDELALHFFPGLNVLTGETGAGKSILIGAISLILGERASSEQVRSGSERTYIEAVFQVPGGYSQLEEVLEKGGLYRDEELVVSREISLSGRNICRVNGRAVPLATLKEIGNVMVDLHGQHTHQSLLKQEQHLFLLDELGGAELLKVKREYEDVLARWQEAKRKLLALGADGEVRARKLELLKHQRDEIVSPGLGEEEEEELKRRLLLLDNAEKLLLAANRACAEVHGGETAEDSALDRINSVKKEFESLLRVDGRLEHFVKILEDCIAGLTELGHELYRYVEELAFSPQERMEIENRLEVYRRLKAKYGGEVNKLFLLVQNFEEEIAFLENSEQQAAALEKEAHALSKEARSLAELLTEKRKETARELERMVKSVLGELGMGEACFSVHFSPLPSLDSRGNEEVEFLFSANAGEPLKPLARIISAGEMARVMLALKSILAEQDRIPTLIFDEIDSGIGGKTIQKVSEKMSLLSGRHQVICVTHSPQIASAAHCQYYLYKEAAGGRTITRVNRLNGEERVYEIARLLDGGSNSEVTRRHAEELLKKAQEYRARYSNRE